MNRIDMDVSFTLDGKDYELEGVFLPGTPDVRYLRNGDPGHPGDPSEYEPTKGTVNGDLIDLKTMSNALYDKMLEAAIEVAEEQYARDEGPEYEPEDEEGIIWIR